MVLLLPRWATAWLVAAIAATSAVGQSVAPAAAMPEPTPLPVADWAFPGSGPPGERLSATAAAELVTVPHSRARFTREQVQNSFAPPDWYPSRHGPMPAIVAAGRKPKVLACGYCHLPDVSGRPENCSLSGLPAAYIEQQLAAFRGGSRQCAAGDAYVPFKAMRALCAELTDAEIADAARYFSQQHTAPKVTVHEVDQVPAPRMYHFIYALDQSAMEPIAGRIIETTEDLEGHEKRDSDTRYVAYVPTGAVARGQHLATVGPAGPATSCFVCHGNDLKGTAVAPPLAGHFASYIFRQLLAFRNGTRLDPLAVTMRPVVANLSSNDLVDLAAFAASHPR